MATDVVRDETISAEGSSQAAAAPPRALRLWPAAVMVLFFWAAYFALEAISLSGGVRFISRLLLHVLLLLGCSIWWLCAAK